MKYIILSLSCLFMFFETNAQVDLGYQTPHGDILELADAERPPSLSLNTAGDQGFMLYRNSYKTIAELSETELRLAGLRINPITNISSRQTYYYKITLFDVGAGEESEVKGLPENPKLANFRFSNDDSKLAFTHTTKKGVELWVLDMKTNVAKRIVEDRINANMGSPFVWFKDDQSILVKLLPNKRPALIDKSKAIPNGPTVSENAGSKAQNRTYQDLLKNPNDEKNFETLAKSELWRVNLSGEKSLWKKNAMHRGISFSPDGNYILLTTIHRPFSYIVTYSRFPSQTAVYDTDGNNIKTILETPLIEELPKGFMAVRKGPRSISWRPDKGSVLYWVEALDGGDPAKEVTHRDAVYQLAAPFLKGQKKLVTKTELRYGGIQWCEDDFAVVSNYWRSNRTLRVSFFNPSNPDDAQVLFNERNYQDRYSDPGSFVTKINEYGRSIIDRHHETLYLTGNGFSKEGRKPFIDEYHIPSKSSKRIYESAGEPDFERISRVMDIAKGDVLVSLESQNKFPNYYLRNLNDGSLKQITFNKNPFKAIQNVHKEVITYKRDDGLDLSGTLYLPVGYEKGKKYPMILWAYPREYKDKTSASQVTASSNQFTYPNYGSAIFWVNRGYVVLDNAAFPIIGEGDKEPNDDFRNQLVSNGKAAIDAVDELGYIDRDRVAVGGHSYGAFMTANLLSHCNLFAAGIARSGAYNRTLTPFGFQSEERSYWEAPDVYYTMSPFMHAEKMKTPLLLIHGEADNNSGTYPMQSERYFNALKGLGATVRLVMLPKESHGYAAKESIMHMLWEQDQWLEKHVKNKKKAAEKVKAKPGRS